MKKKKKKELLYPFFIIIGYSQFYHVVFFSYVGYCTTCYAFLVEFWLFSGRLIILCFFLSHTRHPHRCICSSGEKGDHYWCYPSPRSCKAQATSTFEIVTNTGRIGLRAVTYTDVCLHDIYIYKRNFLLPFRLFLMPFCIQSYLL